MQVQKTGDLEGHVIYLPTVLLRAVLEKQTRLEGGLALQYMALPHTQIRSTIQESSLVRTGFLHLTYVGS